MEGSHTTKNTASGFFFSVVTSRKLDRFVMVNKIFMYSKMA
jgi:hypothetical protein